MNPFLDAADFELDPRSACFDPNAWFRAIADARKVNPQRYPHKELGVLFHNLSVYGFKTSSNYQHTFGNYPVVVFDKVFRRAKSKIQILVGCDGLIRAGETLIVLGRPGSGCTTLLKTLVGETNGIHVEDDSQISYQGIPPEQMDKSFKGERIYIGEQDIHFPELTVKQTLVFGAQVTVPDNRLPGVSGSRHAQHISQVANTFFNLSRATDTKIGNCLIRGVSGGERRRVSIAEAFLKGSSFQCWDNSTRGLDSSAALNLVRLLQASARFAGTTAGVSLYQVSEDIYSVFDKVTLLYEGRQIYFGPAASAKEYFTKLGFICPPRATTADFLTSLTHPMERIIRPGYESLVPRSSDDFRGIWLTSKERAFLLDDIERSRKQFTQSSDQHEKLRAARRAERERGQFHSSPFNISYWKQTRFCVVRGFQRLRSNLSVPVSAIAGNAVLSVIVGSIFYDMKPDTSSFFSRAALLFFATLLNAFSSAFEVLTLWGHRPIVEKHHRYGFYHPSVEAVSAIVTDLPNKILLSLFFNIPFYFLANLRRTAAAFFIFYLFTIVCVVTMSMFFRVVGSLSRTYAQSMVPVAVLILNFVISIGFVIPNPEMTPWLGWIRYVNPLAYTFESLMINEFGGRRFQCTAFSPSGPAYAGVLPDQSVCATIGAVLGQSYVDGNAYLALSYNYSPWHLWRNLGVLFAFMFLFGSGYLLAAEYVSAQRPKGDVLLFLRSKKSISPAQRSDEEALSVERLGGNQKGHYQDPVLPINLDNKTKLFSWEEVSFEIVAGKKRKRLLNEVDGWVQPGTLTALMGMTGAGKTTLLDVLADRTRLGLCSGQIRINGRARDSSFQQKSGYVQQTDIHTPTATVREALNFSALLRQSQDTPDREKLAYVDEVIKSLEMESYAEAIIGVPGDGLNMEQRKRLSIGVEMAAKPELLLFLDEPTSGLDSQSAWLICTLLRKLANNGQAILCTIHQPSVLLFHTFDRLLLLSEGGHQLYFGDIGPDCVTLTEYFQRNGARACSETENPAEWILQVTKTSQDAHNAIDWPAIWRESPEKHQIKQKLSDLNEKLTLSSPKQDIVSREFAAPSLTQLYIVTRRNFRQDWRTPSYLYSKILLYICSKHALFTGFSFWMADHSIQGLQNQVFSIFLLMTIHSNVAQLIITKFGENRALFEARERPAKIYSWKVFILSSLITELPSQTIAAVLTFVCWYYPIGMFRNAASSIQIHERSALMILLLWWYSIFSSTYSIAMAAGIEEVGTAVNMGQLFYMLSLIFCGILVRSAALPGFWIFMYRVSPLTYLVGGMLAAGLSNSSVICSDLERLIFNPPQGQSCAQYLAVYIQEAGGTVLNPDAETQCQFCPVANVNQVLQTFGVQYQDRWRNFGLLWIYIVVNVVGAFTLYWLARIRPQSWRKK